MVDYSEDYLLDKRIKIFQPNDGYRAAIDAVLLAAAVKNVHPDDNILDIGSGTGAISLCIADRFRENEITGVEIQPELAELANKSAQANGFAKLKYINRNIFERPLPFCSFAHVVSNPPYFENSMPTSPRLGKATAHTFSHGNLSDWVNLCIKMVRPQGYLYMINRTEALAEILASFSGRMGEIRIFPFYSKVGLDAKRIIVRAKKDSHAPLSIAPELIIHEADGSYTQAAEAILRGGNCL